MTAHPSRGHARLFALLILAGLAIAAGPGVALACLLVAASMVALSLDTT